MNSDTKKKNRRSEEKKDQSGESSNETRSLECPTHYED